MIKKRNIISYFALIILLTIFILPGSFSFVKTNLTNIDQKNNNLGSSNNIKPNDILSPANVVENGFIYSDNFDGDTLGVAPPGWSLPSGDDPSAYMCFEVLAGTSSNSHNPFSTNALAVSDSQTGQSINSNYNLSDTVTSGTFEFDVAASVASGWTMDTSICLQDSSGNNLIKFELKNIGSGWEYVIGSYTSSTFSNKQIIDMQLEFIGGSLIVHQNGTLIASNLAYTAGSIQRIHIDSGGTGIGGNEVYFDNVALAQSISFQNFAMETAGDAPTGWSQPSGDDPGAYMCFEVLAGTSSNSHNPFSSNALAVSDSQTGQSINSNYNLPSTITSGTFRFDVEASVASGWTMDTSICLQDSSGNNLIKFELKNIGSGWEYVIGSYTSSTFSNKQIINMRLEFIEGSLNVFQNGVLVASNLAYTTGSIERIHIDSGGTGIGGNEVYIDHFNLYAATNSNNLPSYYTPTDIRQAYNWDSSCQGSGVKIGIIEEGIDPNLQSDVNHFDSEYGLPSIDLTPNIIDIESTTVNDSKLDVEQAMDVEWVHAIAPQATIYVIEMQNNDPLGWGDSLMEACSVAHSLGSEIISISYGYWEYKLNLTPSEIQLYDTEFNTWTTNNGGTIGSTIVASSGDNGGQYPVYNTDNHLIYYNNSVFWPACDPNVLAVGGTTLTVNSKGTSSASYGGETAWSYDSSTGQGSGGGVSKMYTSVPSYQSNVGINYGGRSVPDVSFDASPNSPVMVYCSNGPETGPWLEGGGTSLGAPCWAGILADAYQYGGGFNGAQIHEALYNILYYSVYVDSSLYTNCFHDIQSGSNGLTYGGTSYGYSAGAGYDMVTGLGSPNISNLLSNIYGYMF